MTIEKIMAMAKEKGVELTPDIMRGYAAYHQALQRFMVPLADRVKDSLALLGRPDPIGFIMAVAGELDNRQARIDSLEALVDLLSDDVPKEVDHEA